MHHEQLVNSIVKYYINPKKYPNEGKEQIELAIKQINEGLMHNEHNELVDVLFDHFTSTDLSSAINETIYKTRADEQGLSATRGYKEIYFNEIIQNANDNTNCDYLNVVMSKSDDTYEITFEYSDPGFNVANIIGFFNTEIHIKREDLASTGKHGVGIKSLFYFVDHMKIESNVIIEFVIETKVEDGIEKILSASSKITKNERWDKKTKFTIKFPEKKSYGEFNIEKLKQFMQRCLENELKHHLIQSYFFDLIQQNLIFDVRSLLFTNRNKNKNVGIKNITFYKDDLSGVPLFTIRCEEKSTFTFERNKVNMSHLKYNDEVQLSYLLFTIEGENESQNFSAAFPVNGHLKNSKKRYYETYYLPGADETGMNILINSQFSNVARTKLTEDDSKIDKIKESIHESLIKIYRFMTSEQCTAFEQKKELSILFHTLLEEDENFIRLCYEQGINNRYLLKYKDSVKNQIPYIVFKRNTREEYEKKYIEQDFDKNYAIQFFEKYMVNGDAIQFHHAQFIEQICNVYERAFESENQLKLRTVLNVAGTIRDLIYFRIKLLFPNEQDLMLTDGEVDQWNASIWAKEQNNQLNKIALSLIGRYKLNTNISNVGEIKGASFYEYLFNAQSEVILTYEYETLAQMQKNMFSKKYETLKKRLWELVVNKNEKGDVSLYESKMPYNEGEVAFYSSWHTLAGNDTFFRYQETAIYDCKGRKNTKSFECNTDTFGENLARFFIHKIDSEPAMLERIKVLENNYMLVSPNYPQWGFPSRAYNRNKLLATGLWFNSHLININFLKNLYAHNWEDFKFYFQFLMKFSNKPIFEEFELSFNDKNEDNSTFHIDDIDQLYQFFCNKERAEWFKLKQQYIHLNMRIIGEVTKNLLAEDYFAFLKKITGKNIYVVQSHTEIRGTRLMCYADGQINMLVNDEWLEIGNADREQKELQQNDIIIIHDEKMDYKKAISKTLKKLNETNDIIEKILAFIPANQSYAIQGEEYDLLSNMFYEGNPNSQTNITIGKGEELSSKALQKLITARGNNDHKCCCCGKELDTACLIITDNKNLETSKQYPQIFEVVCKKCKIILEKGHKKTQLLVEEDQYLIEYVCTVQNTHQFKEVVYKHKICSGIMALCSVHN